MAVGFGCGDLSPTLVVGESPSPPPPRAEQEPDPTEDPPPGPPLQPQEEDREDPSGRANVALAELRGLPGAAPRGQALRLELVVENLGDEPSRPALARASLIPIGPLGGRAPVEFGGAEVGVVPARGVLDGVTLDAMVPEAIAPGRYRVRVEFDPQNRFGEAHRALGVLEAGPIDVGDLAVEPGAIDFGVVRPGCERTEALRLRPLGAVRSVVADARVAAGPFSLTHFPFPLVIEAGAEATLRLRFAPDQLGPVTARLLLDTDAFVGPREVELRGTGSFDPEREDRFVQRAGPILDVLFVVQDGCARPDCELALLQDSLALGFRRFASHVGAVRADWRAAVTTTDARRGGSLRGPVLDPSTADPIAEFGRQARAGSRGAHPSGLAAARAALGGWVRPDAAMVVIFAALDDDRSGDSPADWTARLALAATGDWVVNGILGPPPEPCPLAGPAHRYASVIAATGGVLSSACAVDDFEALFRFGGRGFGFERRFVLSQRPRAIDTIEVEVDGRPVPSADQVTAEPIWSYDRDGPAIRFEMDRAPRAGASIRVRYRTEC